MRTTLISSLALSWAVVCAAGCKEPEGLDPKMAELAPEGAQLMLGFSLEPLRTSAISELLAAGAKSDPNVAAMITAIDGCEIDVSTLKATMAAPLADSVDQTFAIIEAPGIGKKDALECLEDKSAKALGQDPGNLLLRAHGPVRVAPMEGGGSIIQFNDNAIGVVEGSWEEEILARIEKPEARTANTATAALEAAKTDADLWIAAVVDDNMRSDMSDLAGADALQYLTTGIDIGDDWTLKAGMHFSDAAKAKEFEGSLSAMKDDLVAGGAGMGVPESTMKTLTFEHADKAVHVSITVPKADVIGLAAMAGAMMQ